MHDLRLLDSYRLRDKHTFERFGGFGDWSCGAFEVPSPIDRKPLHIIASSDYGWDHVSVSRSQRCPTWREMDHVRALFFDAEDTVMQLHVPIAENINNHNNCLHLWRPQNQEIPRPPDWMV